MRTLLPLAAMIAAAVPVTAAQAGQLTLERIFASPSLSGPTPRLLKLSPDGRLATLLRNRADDRDRFDLWAVDTTTGEARMLVDSARVGTGAQLSEEEMMRRERARLSGVRGIVSYDWAPDGRGILVPLDGDLYLAGLDGNVRRVTATPETELDAQVSRTGRYLSFVRDQNLHVVEATGQNQRRLTTDGAGTVSWGSAEFVAQEEMDRHTGHWWSPDDRYLAVARVDEAPVRTVTRTAIGTEGTRVYEQRYPAAGTPNALVELYVMAPDGSGRVKVDLGADTDIYLARVNWSADGRTLFVQRESRDQKRLDLLSVDPATGRSTILFSETSNTWLNLHDNLRPLRDGSLLWTSERSGYSHIYRFRSGRWTQLTRGDWAVKSIEGVDETSGRIYFTGNLDTPLEQHLYSIDMNRPGTPRRLTEQGYWNVAEMDGRATRALVTRSSPTQPTQVYLADARGERLAWIEENRLDDSHPYGPFRAAHVAPTFGTIHASDGTELHYRMLSPAREPGRRYPVFVQVYGGPGSGRQVTRAWVNPLHEYLVQQGWIVFSIDNRGSPDRGKAFEDAIYHAMGTVEVEDQLAGVAWLRTRDFVDGDRIAVNGWSYGGYMTLRLLEAAPGTFRAGVSGAPVTRWELYDTHYTERYLGNPAIDPAPYQAAGAVPPSSRITDNLLLIHGMADDNVVFENSTVLMGALQGRSFPFEMMVYPGATHGVSGEARQLHLWRTIENFLNRTVRDGEVETPPAR
ncbi:S9 family peptidase [Sphingosinicella sp. LHD-64]|uniref:S9 family peptidase n=1 Tax=Sphingosinicella sp. LHD-64 TaxID=3072139 RepID=UPI00280F1DBA|nr:S9 family peptidase [Sphingosinicella sp. LHD-64]MDQ8755351.1 S9 family peptidase [Sphingosinicella sp. LHD-64]